VVAETGLHAEDAVLAPRRLHAAREHRVGGRLMPCRQLAWQHLAQSADGRSPAGIGGQFIALCQQQLAEQQDRQQADDKQAWPAWAGAVGARDGAYKTGCVFVATWSRL